jgi:hypothetical protein
VIGAAPAAELGVDEEGGEGDDPMQPSFSHSAGPAVEVPGFQRGRAMEDAISAQLLAKQDAYMATAGPMPCDPRAEYVALHPSDHHPRP